MLDAAGEIAFEAGGIDHLAFQVQVNAGVVDDLPDGLL